MKKYILFSILSILCFSCREDKIDVFSPDMKPTVYFQRNSGVDYNGNMTLVLKRNFADSTRNSFVGLDDAITQKEYFLPISLLGRFPKEPLKIKFKINESLTTAIEGEDFEINLDTTYINPTTGKGTLFFIAKRTEKLLKNELCVAVDIVDSEEYGILEKYNNTDVWNDYTKQLSGRTYRVFFGELVKMPYYWDIAGSRFFGTWTATKYRLLNTIMKWTVSDWEVAGSKGSKVASGVFPYAAFKLRDYLQAEADKGNPILDEDGKYMQLVDVYTVDYSKYEKE